MFVYVLLHVFSPFYLFDSHKHRILLTSESSIENQSNFVQIFIAGFSFSVLISYSIFVPSIYLLQQKYFQVIPILHAIPTFFYLPKFPNSHQCVCGWIPYFLCFFVDFLSSFFLLLIYHNFRFFVPFTNETWIIITTIFLKTFSLLSLSVSFEIYFGFPPHEFCSSS